MTEQETQLVRNEALRDIHRIRNLLVSMETELLEEKINKDWIAAKAKNAKVIMSKIVIDFRRK